MHAPKIDHLAAVYKILKYFKGSPGQGIFYKLHGHMMAEAILMLIGLDSKQTKDLLQVIIVLLVEILFL